MNTGPLIKIQNLSKIYRTDVLETIALSNISFEVYSGEYLAIMGPSGSGKSTLMHILGALDLPSSGKYILNGQDVGTLSDDQLATIRNRQIGFIFQFFNLLPRTNTVKNVMLPMTYAGIPFEIRRQKALKLLKQVDLGDHLEHLSNQLSGGQQQRVAIARALTMDPSILLADEPTGNIASTQAEEIMAIFQQLNDQGRTIVVITHEPDIAQHAKRIIVLKDGRIASDRSQKQKRTINKP